MVWQQQHGTQAEQISATTIMSSLLREEIELRETMQQLATATQTFMTSTDMN